MCEMAGKSKFDQEAAFRSIIGAGRQSEPVAVEMPGKDREGRPDRVQRAYFLDKDIEKALRKKALEDEKNLTETINDVLRQGLAEYL